jgi:uncharacterized repeat protein (TIGR03803 family)
VLRISLTLSNRCKVALAKRSLGDGSLISSKGAFMHSTRIAHTRISPEVLFVAVVGLLLATCQFARAQTETVLYSFCSAPNCADGSGPVGNLLFDVSGNLYGATRNGGKHQYGTIFELTAGGTETLLHTFTFGVGSYPEGSLAWDGQGNLYGATVGASSIFYDPVYLGSVFVLKKRSFGYLHSYKDGEGGAVPNSGLVMDTQGNVYGTTVFGGDYPCSTGYGCGTVYRVTPHKVYTVLYNFMGGTDGESPNGHLVLDSDGNLYGTTDLGGGAGTGCGGMLNRYCGTVFKLAPDGTETILHSFAGGVDGENPNGGLVLDAQGNLYGTTSGGGAGCSGGNGCGTVFKVTAGGKETVLYSFMGGTDGSIPLAGLVMDAQGNLYGTTGAGGSGCSLSGWCGTVFKVTPTGDETILYRFTGGADGALPEGALILDAKGSLYGTTYAGGIDKCTEDGTPPGCGVVFKVTP